MRVLNYILVVLIIGVLGFYAFTGNKSSHVISGKTMGTYYTVKIRSSQVDNLLGNKIQTLLDELVTRHSVFDSESEISKINRFPADEWMDLSPEMSEIMKKSYNIYKLSGGSFDPTVGTLVDLWGFGSKKATKKPTDAEIDAVLKYTGFDKIKFSSDYSRFRKTDKNIYINLSAIVKGYGVDRVAELLESEGYEDFIVEIGGEIRAKGRRSEETDGWNVSILMPYKEKSENAFILKLKDYSVATSGDYRNYYDIDGNVYSHTIDPTTGKPVTNNIASVTVFSEKCIDADALATAIMSMGYTKGLKFANSKNLAVIFFIRDSNDEYKSSLSNQAKKLLAEREILSAMD